MQRLKLSISPCPNDTFMFDAIINGRIDLDGFAFDVAYHDIEERRGPRPRQRPASGAAAG